MTYLATNILPCDGVQTVFNFAFAGVDPSVGSGTAPYLFPEDVYARELFVNALGNPDSAQRTVTLVAPNQLRVEGPPIAAGRQVKIYRHTEIRFPLVDYRDRQSVSELDLDLANRQAVFIAQEISDAASNRLLLDEQDNWDVNGRRIVNLAPGINPTDAVNLEQLTNSTSHSLRVPMTEGPVAALPPIADRVNKLLSFDNLGAPIAVLSTGAPALEIAIRDAINPANGAGMVGYAGTTVANKLDTIIPDLAAVTTAVAGAMKNVDSIAALRALPDSITVPVLVLGYYHRGDGGGGIYRATTDTVSPDNGGSTIRTGTGTMRRKLQIYNGMVTPEQFGAVGNWNGTSGVDDTAAFNNLTSHIVSNGGDVFCVKRYFLPNGWVINASNYRLRMGAAAEIHTNGTGANCIYGTGVANVTIEGGYFTQPRSSLRDQSGFCVYFVNSDNINVHGVKTEGGTAGIWLNHCTNSTVWKSTVDTPKADGIHFSHGSSFCRAIENLVINPGDDGLATTYYGAAGGRPHDNQFLFNKVRGGYWGFGIAIYSGDDMLIQGNDLRETALGAIQTTTHAGGGQCTNIAIIDNVSKGSCRVNAVPMMYWYNTADTQIISPLHMAAFVLSGTNVHGRGNIIDDVRCSIVGAAPRVGVLFDGGALISFCKGGVSRVSGVGINGGTNGLSQCRVTGNDMDSVDDVFILFNGTPITNSLTIAHNDTGLGAFAGSPSMIIATGSGSARVVVVGNTSADARQVQVTGFTNVLNQYNSW